MITRRSSGALAFDASTAWVAASAGSLLGLIIAYLPGLALGLIVACCALVVALVAVRFHYRLPAVFLAALGIVLVGYAVLGRSFAYLGAPPVFIGELMLAFGLVAAAASGSMSVLPASPVICLIVAWSIWGAAGTLPYLKSYGVDALRDAIVWGYSAFALAAAACVVSTRSMPAFVRKYGRWAAAFVVVLPAALAITRFLGDRLPEMPGTGIPLFSTKPGDAGVHLAGAAVFVLGGLYQRSSGDVSGRPNRPRFFWTLWVVAAFFVAALNRGGILAIAAALLVVALLDPIVRKRIAGFALAAAAAATVIVLVSLGTDDTSRLAESSDERTISVRQVAANLVSITGRESLGHLNSTREWRLDWWRTIVDYTVFGRHFWTGKGFGVNLADDDGYQVAGPDEPPLRSPHNIYMTVLARMGVPGLLMFVAVLATFAVSLVRAYLRARRRGALWWARIDLWLLSYWCAFLVNASFDVFLEGPQGGIWFWCLTGVAIGALECQRREAGGAESLRVAA